MDAIPHANTLTPWRKSSYSDNGQNGCVEVSDGYRAGVPVGNSKNPPNCPALVLPAPAWSAFVTAVKGDLARPGR